MVFTNFNSFKHGTRAARLRQTTAVVFGILVSIASSVYADAPHVLDSGLRDFVAEYCIDCHGPDSQKGALRFDTLSNHLDDHPTLQAWVKALDKVSSGLMPPPRAAQPEKKDSRAFMTALTRQLHVASRSLQQRDGRVLLRRLNRNEYETTLRDLLGTQVAVKDLLPDDGTAAGFDNVSEALDISAVHLLRYQEAAERAVRSVLPSREPIKIKSRHTGRQITEKVKTFKSYIDKSVRLVDDRLIMYVRTYDSVPCATDRIKAPGRYRVRASLSTVGTGGRALPVMVTHHGYGTREDVSDRRVHDIPADRATIITEEFELSSREIVVFNGWDLISARELAKRKDASPLKDYAGPGLVVEWVEIEGPIDPFPSRGYRRLFGEVPLKRKVARNANSLECTPKQPRDDAARLIRALLPVAFRRPVGEPIADYYVKLAHDQLDRGQSFQEAMTVAYTAVFCSPHFLFLTEPSQGKHPDSFTRLDDYAVASRLSYLLWSSLPDAELFKLATARKLRDPKVLHAQVERMLGDSKASRFTENFAGQWLDLRNINETTPDPQLYGEFDDFLFWSMPRETQLFFNEILTHNLPLTDFVHSDWTFLNQRLAQHYGIKNVVGGELRKVTLPANSHRGGVLTHAAIMKVTADGSKTSPVLRGTWVLERILGHEPPPPPSDVPDFEPDVRGATTIRQQLDKHRKLKSCAVCHKDIDPPGFALESFDPIGGWRDFYRSASRMRVELVNYPGRTVPRGPDVEAHGQTADGRGFRDIDEYKQLLLADKDQLARNIARKLIIYSTGADIQFADREVVEQLVARSRKDRYGFRSLLHDVVRSCVFLNR